MKYSVFAFVSLLVFQASARSPVVKIDLSGCQWSTAANFSGTLLESQGRHYVVTSSWAQMSAQMPGPRCEKVFSTDGELAVRPVATDHLAGLALYEVLSSIQGLIAPQGDSQSIQVWQLSEHGLQSFSGDIVITGSRRHQIPAWDRLQEWQGSALTAGTVGAGLWSDSQFQGIVSHQYLELIPGAKTKTQRWDLKKYLSQNHVIVISAKDVSTWLQKQIANPEEPIVWRPEDQRAGIDRWVVGDLELTTLCPDESDPNPGGQYPIGGNDGFGIGGDSVLNKACKTAVAISKSGKTSWIPLSLQTWQAQSQTALEQQQDVILWYGLSRTPQGLVRDYIFSTESLVKSALDGNKKWIDQIPSFTPPAKLQPMITSAKDLQSQSMHCYDQLFIREQNVQELTRKLFFYAMLAQSQAWQELQSEDVSSMMDIKGAYAQGWKALLWEGTCNTPRLRESAEKFMLEHQKVWAP
ncbi:hypothetical protein [Bdellovibrio sp. HCB337]|uniref:hypothetical protein n=1 Tax=Bdellovibrio sp. HCB337 TaxID=3394358 RepID=UPI0039A66AE6